MSPAKAGEVYRTTGMMPVVRSGFGVDVIVIRDGMEIPDTRRRGTVYVHESNVRALRHSPPAVVKSFLEIAREQQSTPDATEEIVLIPPPPPIRPVVNATLTGRDLVSAVVDIFNGRVENDERGGRRANTRR